jgi:hypothetical protein
VFEGVQKKLSMGRSKDVLAIKHEVWGGQKNGVGVWGARKKMGRWGDGFTKIKIKK